MDWVKEYILNIVAVGMITAICITLVQKNTSAGMIIKMLGGIFLVITLISPLVKIRFDDLSSLWEQVSAEGNVLAKEGSNSTQEVLSTVIKEDLEAYILDKADELGLTLRITVQMDQHNAVMPQTVKLQGAASPYQKRLLSAFMEEELGITEAQQEWN